MLIRLSVVLLLLLTPLSQDTIELGPDVYTLRSSLIGGALISLPFDSLIVASATPVKRKRKPKRPNVEVLHNKPGIGKFFNVVLCRKEWEDIHDRWVGGY